MKAFLVAFGILTGSLISNASHATPKVQEPREARCEGGRVTGDRALARYAGCRRITGDLTVTGVSSFKALKGLRQVDGTLRLTENSASTLAPLGSLQAVKGLVIDSNPELEEASGLDGLARAERLEFNGNPRLRYLNGPKRIESLEKLTIKNTNLVTFSGFESLVEVRQVNISWNARLISVGALDGVKRTERLRLTGNNLLCACFGLFRGLEQPPSETAIQNNRSLFPGELSHLEPARLERRLVGSIEKQLVR